MSQPSILFVSHDASRSGAPILLLHLLRWLREHTPWNLEVLMVEGGALEAKFLQAAPGFVLPEWDGRLRPGAIRTRLDRRRKISQLATRQWSLVYSNTATNGDILKVVGKKQPVISHIHELATSIRSYGEDNFAAVRRHTTRYIACAEAVKRDLTDTLGIDADRIDVVHEFIPTPHVVGDPGRTRKRIRAELGIPEDAFVVGASGFAAWRKAPDLFLALAKAVNSRGAPAHFVWVGTVSDHIGLASLEHDVRGLGLDGLVHFIGPRPSVLEYFQACDVFAMVSREDPFPLVCLEAASIGTPIVCFDYAGGMKEFVETDCGFVLPYQDIDAMASAVLTLRWDADLRARQQQRAAEKVRLRHDVHVAGPKIVAIIDRTLNEHGVRSRSVISAPATVPMPMKAHVVSGASVPAATAGNPFVSVVITTYNQQAFIEATVQSVLDQTYPNREVLVVDDGSTDDTAARLRSFGDRITYIRQENQGVAQSRNTGVRRARGELVAFMDGDDLWEPQKLAVQVEASRRFSQAGLIVVNSCSFNGRDVLEPSTLRYAADGFLEPPVDDVLCIDSYRALVPHNFIMTTSQVMVPAAVLARVGRSDPSLKICSDYDLYLRIARDHQVVFVNSVMTSWRYTPTSASGPRALRPFLCGIEEIQVLRQHLPAARPEVRRLIRDTMQKKSWIIAREAYYYGCEHDRAFSTRFLPELWRSNRRSLWPLVYWAALRQPPGAQVTLKSLFRVMLPARLRRFPGA